MDCTVVAIFSLVLFFLSELLLSTFLPNKDLPVEGLGHGTILIYCHPQSVAEDTDEEELVSVSLKKSGGGESQT